MELERHPEFARGIALFNAGHHWEAHEAWEAVWKDAKAAGDVSIASFVQGLIWCAAAWVKRRTGEPRGASLHAERVAVRMAELRQVVGDRCLGLSLDEAVALARQAADGGPAEAGTPRITGVRPSM